ncbi:hypothetical protein [Paenibacillus sp. DMB5]|uniref:hypothetical protein n=1 Tax=Paenibacillus sp. DMB5 TaxID=1780103 RepID=UPI000B2BA4B1|nr:hypothetical protein [Paenibacillus sp. DMB5]
MIRLQKRLFPALAAVLGMLLLQACGQNTVAEGDGESFAAAAEAPAQSILPADAQASPVAQVQAGTPEASAAPPAERLSATALPAVGSSPAGVEVHQKESAAPSAKPAVTSEDLQSGKQGAAAADNTAPGTPKPAVTPSAAAAVTPKPVRQPGSSTPGTPAPAPVKQPKSTGSDGSGGGVEQQGHSASAPAASPSPAAAAAIPAESTHSGISSIDWNGFFDGSDQTRPSEHFWDLSGSKVKIKGFMGEVLSFEKNWFLLIPEPGAECPFDNGDETYWNKIMIVFVPGGDKLRYTSGPLEITGRLDVGIKIDESGYKTMFRLYDASFKSL